MEDAEDTCGTALFYIFLLVMPYTFLFKSVPPVNNHFG